MEVNSYFGEFELLDDTSRRWTVLAKTFLVVYVIPKNEFLDLIKEKEFRDPFLKHMQERLDAFQRSDRECSRAVRRLRRVEGKIKEVKLDTKKKLKEKIIFSKQKSIVTGKANWYEMMKNSQKKEIHRQIEMQREKEIQSALENLKTLHQSKDPSISHMRKSRL